MTLRVSQILMLGATLMVVAAAPHARAQADPASTVKPLVVFLLDTSGSMEYESGTALNEAVEFTVPLCDEPGATSPTVFAAGDFPRSRLIVAKEVLTGTYRDYWCRYDYRDDDPEAVDYEYPVPHVQACSGSGGDACVQPAQEFDGLLDLYRDFIHFSFMTFDSREAGGSDEDGMWSYGPASATNAGVNLGVKNELWGEPNMANEWDAVSYTWTVNDADRLVNNRGQLMPPPHPSSDDFATLRASNRMLQYEVNSTIGYWGTPLAPMLEDAEWFLRNHSTVKPWNPITKAGDPYSNCRDRLVVLITDGRASMGEGMGGYSTTVQALQSLKATPPASKNPKVYVVGYNLADEDASLLDEVADHADGVFIADTATGLRTALAEIFALAQATVQSRTEVVYTNATQSSIDMQYQFNAAFQSDPDNPTNLKGYLNQTVYQCSGDCIGISAAGASCAMELIQIHEELNDRPNSTRTLYAVVNGALHWLQTELVDLASDGAEMASLFGVQQTGNLPQVAPIGFDGQRPIFSQASLGPAADVAIQKTYMKDLIRLLRADDGSARQGEHMGGVVHSTPVVQEPVTASSYPLRSWSVYAETPLNGTHQYPPKCRPTVLYAGTHDGMIHAFRVDRFDSDTGSCAGQVPTQADGDRGKELWSVMPQHLLKESHGLVGAYRFLMDGQMRLSDVLLVRANPTESDPTAEANSWRSVLTAGYGSGGRGFIALNVTNALDGPEVMWELDHEQRCIQGTCYPADGGAFVDDFSKLGLTKSRPSYGTSFLDNREVAVAVLPAGDDPDDASRPEAGRAVYIVRLDTGEKVAEFSNDSGNVTTLGGGTAHLTYHFTGSPAIYSNVPGVVSTRAFVGDAGGRLWRIDMRATDPDDWKMELFFDTFGDGALTAKTDNDRQPILGAPALALNAADGHLAVVFGNGGIDHIRTASDSEAGVFSVSETSDVSGAISSSLNWVNPLADNERLTGEAIVFNRTSYFTTYLSDELDACAAGSGRIYGLHFTSSTGTDPVGTLDADQDATTLDAVEYVGTGEAVPFGVQIIERPSCKAASGSGSDLGGLAGGTSGSAQGDLQLVVNVAKGAGFDAASVPPGVNGENMATKNLTRSLTDSGEMVQGGTWGYVLF